MTAHAVATKRRTEKLDLRISPEAKARLQTAAAVMNRSMSDFVMETALARAEETLADRNTFGLDRDQWKAFQKALDEPVRPLPRMRKLLKKPGYFDRAHSR